MHTAADDLDGPGRPALPARLRAIARHDLPASLVVFLVAVPLSLGIAVASGAPVMAGVIAAAVGGVVAGALGGSVLQVSGPAAGLAVIVADLVARFGWAVTCAITVAAGLLQVLLGLARVARSALAISPVVVHAMLAGIGVTIVLQQVHVLLGGEQQASAFTAVTALPAAVAAADPAAVAVGGLVVALLVLWPRLPARVRLVPAPLAAVLIATVLAAVLALDVRRVALPGDLLDAVAPPVLPTGQWAAVAGGVLTVALAASVASLLAALAIDRTHGGPRTDLDRELVGQGAANMVSGLLGGLPVTGEIARGTANVDAGARTRVSAVLHGVWVLLFAVLLAGSVRQVPLAVLAGLLVVVGVRLVKPAGIRAARCTGETAVYLATVLGVVFVNLLAGVLLGLGLALLLVLRRVVTARIRAEQVGCPDAPRWRVAVVGSLSFLALPALVRALTEVPPGSRVTIDLEVDFLDLAARDALTEWARRHEAAGGTVAVAPSGAAALAAVGSGPPRRVPATPDLVSPPDAGGRGAGDP